MVVVMRIVIVVVYMVIVVIVVRIPMVVISVVVMPVPGAPGIPVPGIVTPVPAGTPYNIIREENKPYHWPVSHIIIGGGDHHIGTVSHVPWIGRIGIGRFNDIIPSVQCLVTDELYAHFAVAHLFDGEYGHILAFGAGKHRPQNDRMDVTVDIVVNGYVVNQIVTVKVKVVDPGILLVQLFLKAFKRFGFLEKFHYCIEVKIITRQAEILIRHVLGSHCAPSLQEECEDRDE